MEVLISEVFKKMKQNKNKVIKVLILIILFGILLNIPLLLVVAQDEEILPLPYLYNSMVPQKGDLKSSDIFKVNIFSGSAGYLYPLKLPLGTNNLQPKVSLFYDSQSITGSAPGVIGAGWELSQNYISRDVNYTFADISNDKFKLILNGQTYNLIYDATDSRWHTKIESYFYIKNLSGGNNTNNIYWIVKFPDGTNYRLGYNNESEQISNQENYTVRWYLDLVNDTYNNKIYYSYRKNPYPNDNGTVYPDKILYNNDKNRSIKFVYENSDRSDLWTVYEQGNKIRESRRLKEIEIKADSDLVRKYLFEYSFVENDVKSLSFLSNITEYGNDNQTHIPKTKLNYNSLNNNWSQSSSWILPNCRRYDPDNEDTGCFVTDPGLSGYRDNGIRLADVNGDGLIDIMRGIADSGTSGGYSEIWINIASKGYLLKNITNQFGGSTLIDYKKSTELDNNGNDSVGDLGFNIWVVSNITEFNGMNNSQNLTIVKTYNYSGGKYEYYPKNEFRGFSYVDEKLVDKKIQHWFYQDDGKKGNEYKTEVLDYQDNTFRENEYFFNSTQKNGYYITLLSEESEYSYDGNLTNPKIQNISYDYDNFGNIIKKWSKGDINDSTDDKYEYYEYLNNSNLWIVNKVKNYSLFNNNSVKIKGSLYAYDSLDYGQAPTKGSLTSKEDWLNGGENPITNYSYDNYGNLINETDANNHTTRYVYGIRDTGYTFIDQIINAKGHILNYNHDLGTGNLLWETDANNNYKNYTYDVFGRKTGEILPYDTLTYPTTKYEYDFDGIAPEKIKISKREISGINNTLDSYSFYDGFGRLIQNKFEAENQKQIISNIFYDNYGRIKSKSNPYFIDYFENYSVPNSSINNMSYEYDILDRITKILNSDNTSKNLSYNHWNITTYDENGDRKDYQMDAYNKIIKVLEHNDGNIYITYYKYDVSGNLIEIKDAKGNIFNYTYDSLGRKIKMKDPDLGIWNYSYDKVGNILKQTDNRNITISMEYDELNRITKKISSEENITYAYDTNKNNTLSKVETKSSIINYTYDNQLRKISEMKTINIMRFIINYSYDAMDRVILKILPDNTNITYSYNNQGKLGSIKDIINISYNELNKPVTRLYKNGLLTNYTYNTDNFRLIKIKTESKQDLDYGYDFVGNVKQINDTINLRKSSMSYDNLDRLIYTNIVNYTLGENKEINFSYNEIGNMMNMTANDENITFSYENLAHAPYKMISTKEVISLPNDTHKFYIKDNSENNVAWLGDSGNIVLKGICNATSICTAPANSFIIANSSDNTVAYIDNEGNLCIEKGNCSDESASCNPIRDAFIIRNSTSYNMSYIDFNGELCLTGKLYENINL